jgi:hypothetical protein
LHFHAIVEWCLKILVLWEFCEEGNCCEFEAIIERTLASTAKEEEVLTAGTLAPVLKPGVFLPQSPALWAE